MKLLFILCTFFIFTFPAFGQDDIDGFLYFSRQYAQEKKYAEAVEEINKAIDIQPSNASLYLKRARLYRQLQNSAATLENVLTAVSLKPDDPDFLVFCAKELNLSGNYDESLKIAERLISSKERYKTLIGYRISYKTRFLSGDFNGAIEEIITSRDIEGAYHEDRDLYFDPDKRDSLISEGLLVKTLNHLKDDPKIFVYYGAIFAIVEQLRKKEIGSVTGLFMRYYMDCDLYAHYALVYEEKHTPAETVALFDNYAKEFSLEKRAEVFKRMKKYELAVKDLTEVLKTTQPISYVIMRGDLYLSLNQFDKAIADYETAVKIDKGYSDSLKKKISDAKRIKNEINQPK